MSFSLGLAFLAFALPARAGAPSGGETLSRRLKNGFEVVLSEDHAQPVFSVIVRYRVGSRDDPQNLAELAHLVEHLSFRDAHRGEQRGFELADLAGVEYNALTVADETEYEYSGPLGPLGALSRVLWLERQRMAFTLASLTQADVARERGVIDAERSTMRADVPGGLVRDFTADALYPPGHPYAVRPERGCALHCELQHAQWLMQRGYRPDNARLVVVGDFDAHALLNTIDQLFGAIENPGVHLPAYTEVPVKTRPTRITVAAPVARSMLHLYWRIPQTARSQPAALRVLETSLTRELNRMLNDRPGLAVNAGAETMQRELDWLWSIGVELLPGIDPKFVERRILAVLARFRDEPPASESLETDRDVTLLSLLERWDLPARRASLLAEDGGFGFELGQRRSALSRVSAKEVQSLARQCLTQSPLLTVYVRRALDASPRGELYREPE
ncbi:MAG: insulinase family protein [Pseudomonadota bacterium]